jgi:hypothetical protein
LQSEEQNIFVGYVVHTIISVLTALHPFDSEKKFTVRLNSVRIRVRICPSHPLCVVRGDGVGTREDPGYNRLTVHPLVSFTR